MDDRFADLKKLPKDPARRLLALANARLATPITAPAAAPVPVVLEELSQAEAIVDMLRLLAIALPQRERVWWGCLAAQDILAARGQGDPPPPLAAARDWVFKPGDDTREAARLAGDAAEIDDDSGLCCMAVAMCDGKLGPGDLAAYDAPPGAAAAAIFGINVIALGEGPAEDFQARGARLIDRALDIARGGNGRVGSDGDGPPNGAESGLDEGVS